MEYKPLTAALEVAILLNTSSVSTLCCGFTSKKSLLQDAMNSKEVITDIEYIFFIKETLCN
jgi:hypothetical protein